MKSGLLLLPMYSINRIKRTSASCQPQPCIKMDKASEVNQRFPYPTLVALGCGHCKCNYQTASQTATCRRRVLRYCNQHVASSSPGILIMAFNCPITSGMCDWRDWHVINESRGYRARSISAIGLGRIRLQAILSGDHQDDDTIIRISQQ